MDFFKRIEAVFQKPTDAIIGVFVGWLLTVLAGWVKERSNDKKAYRVVFFHLIKVYGLIKSIDQPAIEKVMMVIFSRIPGLQEVSADDPVLHTMTTFLVAQQVKAMHNEELPNLSISFSECILEVAKLDPFLALELSNSVSIKETLERLDSMSSMITEAISQEVPQQEMIPQLGEDIKPLFFTKTLQDLEKDIKKIAKRLTVWEYYKTHKELRSAQMPYSEESIERAKNFLIELIEILQKKYDTHQIGK